MRIESGFPLVTKLFCRVWFFFLFIFLVIYFSVAGVLEERLRDCRRTTRGSVGNRSVMGIHTVIKVSRCGSP